MKKELRVFIVEASDIIEVIHDIGNVKIDSWYDDKKLSDQAKKFITMAEEQGTTYSLRQFVNEFNFETAMGTSSYLFITNKY